MKWIKSFVKKLWKDQSGQGSTEYILVLALLVAIILIFKGTIIDRVKSLVGSVMTRVETGASEIGK